MFITEVRFIEYLVMVYLLMQYIDIPNETCYKLDRG